jgi:hypothetical protein
MKQHPTNVEFVTDMMEFSDAGGLKQAFVIEAIHKYATYITTETEWRSENACISPDAWLCCAEECLDAIDNRVT